MSSRLYVGNLSYDSTPEAIRAAFEPFGEVTDVQIVVDRYSGRPRGFAFVTMAARDQAARAATAMNGATLDGRLLRVNEAEQRVPSGLGDDAGKR
ncbi:MAG TPA: RNA-binding protein [Polyangiaceae bacterium]|jgi:RNA recognition motif-containing protein